MEIPLIPATQRKRKPIPWLPLLVGGIVCFSLLMVIAPVVAQKKERATYPVVAAARSEGRDLLNWLGFPPGSTPADFRVIDSDPRYRTLWNAGHDWLSWTHSHDTEGEFTDVVAWYGGKLSPKGWRVHKGADASGVEYCKAPWLLRLTHTSTGYDLRLEWNNRFTAKKCEHP